MGLFVGSLVFQLFEKALGRISVICLSDVKAAPLPVCACVCMVQKPKERLLKKPKRKICSWSFAAADFWCFGEHLH